MWRSSFHPRSRSILIVLMAEVLTSCEEITFDYAVTDEVFNDEAD